MAPVKTAVILPTGARIDLIIPLRSGATLTILQDLAIERAARYHSTDISLVNDILLRLEAETGPFLHPDDEVEDVVSAGETVFVLLKEPSIPAHPQILQTEPSTTKTRSSNDFQLRVITPRLAHCHRDTRTIPLVQDGQFFSPDSTLRDLRAAVAKSLDMPLAPEDPQSHECNCKIADMSSSVPRPPADDGLKVLVVSGFCNIAWLDILEPTHGAIMASLRSFLGESFEDVKSVHLKGGDQADDDRFVHLPIVSVCAKSRHSDADSATITNSALNQALDLHTAEGPIEISCLDRTIEQHGLTDLLVNGVLSIYAIERRAEVTKLLKPALGKDALFTTAHHWDFSRILTSLRGSSAFLSSLRVFTHKINAKEMDRRSQNNVLRIVHELTRYFPAVRAIRILMDGKTLRPNECAAILQPFAEALRDLVPRDLIEHDQRRYLEGARLLFGFILQQGETLSTKASAAHNTNAEDEMPYLDFFKTVDLRDVRTDEAIVDLVQTNLGLMERGCFAAFQPGGILAQLGMENVDILPVSLDPSALRAAMLNGGIAPETRFYDTDAIQAALSHNAVTKDPLEELRVFSRDLAYLAKACHTSGLTVAHPTSLKSAGAPVLTLDRAGNLCVYVGRTACAAPDRDISIFRPSGGTEEAVDVNIVAQLIEPIIRAREQDGTTIFELFSESLRFKTLKPTELLMFCVDCSESMSKASDFHEIHEAPAIPMVMDTTMDDVPVTSEIDEAISSNDVNEWLSNHESFDDMIAIVASVDPYRKRAVAEEVVEFVSLLTSRELLERYRRRAKLRTWATRTHLSDTAPGFELQLSSLRRLLGGLNVYKAVLSDLIFLKALSWTEKEEFPWTYGGPIPDRRSSSSVIQRLDVTDHLNTPPEIVCPISHAVFEDPVTTSDNFTYERLSIERWFQIRDSSPSTNLPLRDLSLRRNQSLYDQAKRWVSGEDILRAASPASSTFRLHSSRAATELTLNFVTPAGTFTRKVPSTLSLADLHQLVYRGMRGVSRDFSLHLHGSLLEPSDQQLRSRRISSGTNIVASMQPVAENTSAPVEDGSEKMCLVKVYESSSELFSYWIPQDTSHSMASIIFRYWRFRLSVPRRSFTKDQEVWSDLKYGGDGAMFGKLHNHWDLLANALNLLSPQKLVPREELCSASMDKSDETGSQISTSSEGNSSQTIAVSVAPADLYRVLKVELSIYQDPQTRKSMRREELRSLTRLDVSKQVFDAFINRLIAYDFPTMIGLVSFGTSPSLVQPLTAIIENFRHAVDTMKPSGDTSLWAALGLAADQLVHLGQNFPGIPKRIVCLSDGVDTKSAASANDVCRRLIRDRIVMDSCSIGSEDNSQLRALSFLTGGYKFVPRTLEEAMAISELEPVLSIHERPPIARPVMASLLTSGNVTFAASQATADEVTRDNFPVRKLHPNLDDQFVRIDALGRVSRSVVATSINENSLSKPILRQRRILSEIRNLASNPHPSYDVYVSESNMGFWKVVMSGPSESAYASGTFVLYLEMGDDYPQSPPQARFITRIFHPNINLGGRACHSIFSRNYTVDMTTKQMLDTVFGLLLVPEFTDPINTVVTLNFYWDEVAFREEVRSHIEKYALKGREELGREIVGE